MRFSHIDAFRAVMLSGSMTIAAKEMNTSQPNISRLISQLEKEIGFKLFVRISGRLEATPEAFAFYRDVERSYVGLSQLGRSAQSIRLFGTGHLRIGAVPSIALTVLPGIVKEFASRHQSVRVSMHSADSATIAQWTASRYCDVGIASYITNAIGVETELALQTSGVCVLPRHHRLAGEERPLTPRDLDGEAFISLSHEDRKGIDAVFSRAGDKRVLSYESQYAAVICNMVSIGMGLGIVNPVVAHHFKDLDIAIVPFSPEVPFQTYVMFPNRFPNSDLAADFALILKNHLQDLQEGFQR